MTKLVLDSSVLIKWITSRREESVEKARDILLLCQNDKVKVLVPELVKFEIGNALWKKQISLSEVSFDQELFYDFPIEFVSWDVDLAKKTTSIAIENKITYYDASFVALAEKYRAVLVTDNPKHQKIKNNSSIKIIALKDY